MQIMQVLFTNPPYVRMEGACPENNFRGKGILWRRWFNRIPEIRRIIRLFGKARYGVRAGSRWPFTAPDKPMNYAPFPFFMAYAVAYLSENGISADIYDAVVEEQYDYEKYIRKILDKAPEIVFIETSTPTIDIDLWVAGRLSEKSDVCLIGPHATIYSEDMIKLPFVKYVIRGEYEKASLRLIRTKAPGIYGYDPVEDIDSFPYPYRDPRVINRYYDPSMPTPKPQLQIYGSRGCPFKCIFCMWPQVMYQGKYRPRSPKKIGDEIRYCIDHFGSKSILFDDDTFNLGTKRVSQLCEELRSIGLSWTFIGRFDTSPFWLFDKMVDSGCVGMRFGVESFNQKLLNNIKKHLDANQVIETIHYLKQKHPQLEMHLTTMKYLPGETEEYRKYDLKILKEIGFDTIKHPHHHQVASCIPFPGTELYNELQKIGFSDRLNNWTLYDGSPDRNCLLEDDLIRLGANFSLRDSDYSNKYGSPTERLPE